MRRLGQWPRWASWGLGFVVAYIVFRITNSGALGVLVASAPMANTYYQTITDRKKDR